MSNNIILTLLSASFSPPFSAQDNILDQDCKFQTHRQQMKEQSVRKWAQEWEEQGNHLNTKHFYAGVQKQLAEAENGEKRQIGGWAGKFFIRTNHRCGSLLLTALVNDNCESGKRQRKGQVLVVLTLKKNPHGRVSFCLWSKCILIK